MHQEYQSFDDTASPKWLLKVTIPFREGPTPTDLNLERAEAFTPLSRGANGPPELSPAESPIQYSRKGVKLLNPTTASPETISIHNMIFVELRV